MILNTWVWGAFNNPQRGQGAMLAPWRDLKATELSFQLKKKLEIFGT